MKKAYIQTFGCQMNEHDSDRIAELLKRDGYFMSDNPFDSQVIILNTCSVRESPENKVYSQLGRIREYKENNKDVIIGVGGCVAQQEGDRILKREKAVDLVFGTDQLMRVPELVENARQGRRESVTSWMKREGKKQNFIPVEELNTGKVEGGKAYLSITKGCDNFCSFCVVPFTRGRLVSRDLEHIVLEAEDLIRKGAKEIMLLGQNVNSYKFKDYDFYYLLKTIAALNGLDRLRFISPHPKDWNDQLSELMADSKVICDQLHLPFQSGSTRIVDLMNRGHTTEEYCRKINYLKKLLPSVGLSTDIIVGFPTETEEDFQSTLDVLEELRFTQIYAFKYSSRPKTRAEKMEDDVPKSVKEERLARALNLQQKVQRDIFDSMIGKEYKVLIHGTHPKSPNSRLGKTESNVSIQIDDCAYELGEFANTTVISTNTNSLVGQLVS